MPGGRFFSKGDLNASSWGELSPYALVSRIPNQGAGGCGGIKRELPLVGAPYGMPRNFDMPPLVVPRIEPEAVLAIGADCCESVLARVVPPAHAATAAPASPLVTVLLSITMCPLPLRAHI